MKRFKSTLLGVALAALALVGMTFAPTQARAQVVVCANCSDVITQYLQYAKEIESYVEMTRQTELFIKQLADLDKQLTAMITNRGFGQIAVENYTQILPGNYVALQDLIYSGGRLGSIAQREFGSLSQLNTSAMNPTFIGNAAWERFHNEIKRKSENKALAAQEFEFAQDRFTRLDYLREAIGQTDDQKGILEVNARLSAENTNAVNELVKLMAAANFQKAQDERDQLYYKQLNMEMVTTQY
jgi:type IV secretion system protein VirB5